MSKGKFSTTTINTKGRRVRAVITWGTVGQSFGTASSVWISGRRVWTSDTYPYGFAETALNAAQRWCDARVEAAPYA